MTTVLLIIWALGAIAYIALSLLAVPDFLPSDKIKIKWAKAVAWPLVLVKVFAVGLCKLITARSKTPDAENETLELRKICD